MSIVNKTASLTGALVIVGSVAFLLCAAADESPTKKPCCFTNPRFTGTCEVTPGEKESCTSILAYLNNQQSVGKNYCANTSIRGGWTKVDCKEN